uniref:Uncharacterized protein n=1 Tax=Cacopsylla melanoneura TaxID=428564 RepID=A0A8D8SI87_9HEMI
MGTAQSSIASSEVRIIWELPRAVYRLVRHQTVIRLRKTPSQEKFTSKTAQIHLPSLEPLYELEPPPLKEQLTLTFQHQVKENKALEMELVDVNEMMLISRRSQ